MWSLFMDKADQGCALALNFCENFLKAEGTGERQ